MRPRTVRLAVGVAVLVYVFAIVTTLGYAWLFVDSPLVASLFFLTIVGGLAALVGLVYFLSRGVRGGSGAVEDEFTWAVAIVLLFLHGVAPGLIATGLYAVVEREFSARWLLGSLLAALLVTILLAGGFGLQMEAIRPAAAVT